MRQANLLKGMVEIFGYEMLFPKYIYSSLWHHTVLFDIRPEALKNASSQIKKPIRVCGFGLPKWTQTFLAFALSLWLAK